MATAADGYTADTELPAAASSSAAASSAVVMPSAAATAPATATSIEQPGAHTDPVSQYKVVAQPMGQMIRLGTEDHNSTVFTIFNSFWDRWDETFCRTDPVSFGSYGCSVTWT